MYTPPAPPSILSDTQGQYTCRTASEIPRCHTSVCVMCPLHAPLGQMCTCTFFVSRSTDVFKERQVRAVVSIWDVHLIYTDAHTDWKKNPMGIRWGVEVCARCGPFKGFFYKCVNYIKIIWEFPDTTQQQKKKCSTSFLNIFGKVFVHLLSLGVLHGSWESFTSN